jgi:hypothetical protein
LGEWSQVGGEDRLIPRAKGLLDCAAPDIPAWLKRASTHAVAVQQRCPTSKSVYDEGLFHTTPRRCRADDTNRPLTETAHIGERDLDVLERGTQVREQALSRVGGRDGARGPREEPQSQALIEGSYRLADRPPADPQLGG